MRLIWMLLKMPVGSTKSFREKVGFQDKENEKEKVLTDRKTAIRKLDELKQFLTKKKQASFQKLPS